MVETAYESNTKKLLADQKRQTKMADDFKEWLYAGVMRDIKFITIPAAYVSGWAQGFLRAHEGNDDKDDSGDNAREEAEDAPAPPDANVPYIG